MEKKKYTLNDIGNKNPFAVPDNYFEEFSVNIEKQISSEKKAVTVPLFQKLRPLFYAAAVLIGVFFVGDYLSLKTSSNSNNNTLNVADSAITEEQSEALLAYIDENTLIEFLINQDE